MSLSQTVIPNNSILYDAASGANLTMVKAFFDAIHQGLNSNMRADGGSVEDGEAAVTFGTMSFGIHYVHPRENYDNHDRFVIVAENGGNANQVYEKVDFTPEPGDTVDSATTRWLNTARTRCLAVMTALALPFRDILPPALGLQAEPLNIQPE